MLAYLSSIYQSCTTLRFLPRQVTSLHQEFGTRWRRTRCLLVDSPMWASARMPKLADVTAVTPHSGLSGLSHLQSGHIARAESNRRRASSMWSR